MRSGLVGLGFFLSGLLMGQAWAADAALGKPAAVKSTATPIQVSGVSKSPAAPAVRVLVKAAREAHITSQVSGRITALPLKMGQAFRKGDLLVGFDCAHQQAELASAGALLNKAEKVLASKQSLASMKAASDMDVQLAAADVAAARAQLDRGKASVSDCSIHAPYNGSVVRVVANHAEFVGPGSLLIEIVESGNLHVEALVKSSWLTWLKPGHKFTVVIDELGKEVTVVVSAIGARVDPVSQTIPITGRIVQGVPGLRPGMSGNARFVQP